MNYVEITGNSAYGGGGGGIFIDDAIAIINNATISGNSAGGYGSGILSNSSIIDLNNSIIWGNYGEEPIFITSSEAISISYSDIQGGWMGNGNINMDPLFSTDMNDYTLCHNSPCIDAGDLDAPLDPDGTIADMGAYYYNQEEGPTGDVNLDCTINVMDVVIVVGAILGNSDLTPEQEAASDMNMDGMLNVMDIVILVNIILGN